MGAFIGSAIIIIIAAFISYFAKRRIEDIFFVSFSFVAFTLYIFGILGSLIAGVVAVGIISFLCLIAFAIYLNIDKDKFRAKLKDFTDYIVTPGFFVFILLTVFFVILNYGREYYLNDEFSHWGLSIKNMFALDKFSCVTESSDTFKDYPPFATLICYFWSAVTGRFNESYTFTGMGLLLFSCLLPCFKVFSFKNKKTLGLVPLFISICFILTVSLKLSAFTILAVDTLMALIPVYIFLVYFIREKDSDLSAVDIILISVALAALTSTKSIGVGFAVFVVLLLTADMFFFNRKSGIIRKVLFSVCSISAITVAAVSWKMILTACDYVSDGDGLKKTLLNLYEMVFRTDEMIPYRKTTVELFIKASFEGRFAFGISLFAIVVVLVFLCVLFVILNRKERKKVIRYSVLLASMVIALILYLKAILYTFAYKFTEYEAVNLASYERYIGTFLTMWMFFVVILYFKEFYGAFADKFFCRELSDGLKVKKICTVISILSVCGITAFYGMFYPYTAKSSSCERTATDHAAVIGRMYDTLKKQNPDSDASDIKICYVTELEDNRDYLIANYNAAPFTLTFDKEWYDNLEKYDYFYIDVGYNGEIPDGITEKNIYKVVVQDESYCFEPVFVK